MSTLEIIAATSLVAQTLLAKRFIESWPLWIAVDTDATTTVHFAREYHGYAMPELEQLAHQARERYDLFFLCDTDMTQIYRTRIHGIDPAKSTGFGCSDELNPT